MARAGVRPPTRGRVARCSSSTAHEPRVTGRRAIATAARGRATGPRGARRCAAVEGLARELAPILERAWLAGWSNSPSSTSAPSGRAAHRVGRAARLRLAPAVRTALTAPAGHPRPVLRPSPPPPAPARARRPRPHAPPGPGPPAHVARVDRRRPRGRCKADLVLHCGESTAGLYAPPWRAVDVATTCAGPAADLGPATSNASPADPAIAQRLPFPPARVWHSGNGRGEFVERVPARLESAPRRALHPRPARPQRTTRPGSSSAWPRSSADLGGYDRDGSRAAGAVRQRLDGVLRLHTPPPGPRTPQQASGRQQVRKR